MMGVVMDAIEMCTVGMEGCVAAWKECLQNAIAMAPPALQRGQRVAAVAVGSQAVLQILSRVSGRQAPPQLSGSGGVEAGLVVVPDGGGEGLQPHPSSSQSPPDLPPKAK